MSFEIEGGSKIEGQIQISGSKNSALPILISSLLSSSPICLNKIPKLKDIEVILKILSNLGVEVEHDLNQSVILGAKEVTNHLIDGELVNQMRASVLVIGPMLSRFGEIKIALPGGCAIGERPIDLHISAFRKMGAEVEIKDGCVIAKAKKMFGAKINFEKVSVTGSANVIMAATLAKGTTEIINAAREPEVVDLINCLNQRGARISGGGTSRIRIEGVNKLKPIRYKIISDRIEAATYLIAAALCDGKLEAVGARADHLVALIDKLRQSGFKVHLADNLIRIESIKKSQIKATKIKTAPFPNFATDLQALYAIINCYADGISSIEENIFENRFSYFNQLHKMGAKSEIKGNTAYITGVKELTGARLIAPDLRAGAALVLAALSAKGTSTVANAHFIERGYEYFSEKLTSLGAKIKIITKAEI